MVYCAITPDVDVGFGLVGVCAASGVPAMPMMAAATSAGRVNPVLRGIVSPLLVGRSRILWRVPPHRAVIAPRKAATLRCPRAVGRDDVAIPSHRARMLTNRQSIAAR